MPGDQPQAAVSSCDTLGSTRRGVIDWTATNIQAIGRPDTQSDFCPEKCNPAQRTDLSLHVCWLRLNHLKFTCCGTQRSPALSSFSQTTGDCQGLSCFWGVLFLLGFRGANACWRTQQEQGQQTFLFRKHCSSVTRTTPLVPPAAPQLSDHSSALESIAGSNT